jgi:uncharacterized protein YraI
VKTETIITRVFMRTRLKFMLALAIASCIPPVAAQTATISSSVNVRSGPDSVFPIVTWLMTGTSVTVEGCTANWRWCDISAGRTRGWVYTRFLSYPHKGTAVTVIQGGPSLGLPQTEFSLGSYWDAHYQGQRWYAQKAEWQRRWDQRPAPREWRQP